MKYVFNMYYLMIAIVAVVLVSEFLLKGVYSAIASWLVVALFFFGTLMFINAKFYLKKSDSN
ncbi:hypothetical protein [Mangrovibacillus cuniculi]|uniref:Uncharacterized protein n=1 Tax=Mangrovibacillus cuniculi TaxID=2593652 RepID=A0A7S8C9I5_9BACI|nr:hypothetical protein [Mangrovibacillus cuniculi]QPC45900.1 hypothetical protein G8O30_02480 [Mangrovibacillus cuniculi]